MLNSFSLFFFPDSQAQNFFAWREQCWATKGASRAPNHLWSFNTTCSWCPGLFHLFPLLLDAFISFSKHFCCVVSNDFTHGLNILGWKRQIDYENWISQKWEILGWDGVWFRSGLSKLVHCMTHLTDACIATFWETFFFWHNFAYSFSEF